MHNSILPQDALQVNKHLNNRNEVLALADEVLAQARRFRAEWLTTGDGLSWRQAEAALQDREALIIAHTAQMGCAE